MNHNLNFMGTIFRGRENSFFKLLVLSTVCLFTVGSVNADNLLMPSLLIDVSVTNSTPGANEQFCYKIRYRCNSTTEHCTDAYIEFTLPDGVSIGSLPPAGGHIVGISESPGSPSGTLVTVDLGSPASSGLPSGTLAAGSSGIFEICLAWECVLSDDAQFPAAGSTIGLVTDPVFYASGTSTTAAATSDLLVPTFNECPTGFVASGSYKKTSPAATSNVNPGGMLPYIAHIPVHNGPMIFTDMFDTTKLRLSNVELPNSNWQLEILCNNSWFTIPSNYSDLSDWLADNATAGTLSNLEVAGVPTGCHADLNAIAASSNGYGYETDITGVRVTTDTTNRATFTDFLFMVRDDVPVGATIGNCFEYSDTTIGTVCAKPHNVVAGTLLNHSKRQRSGLGNLTVPTFPSGMPAKQADDILWEARWGAPNVNADPVSGFLLSDTLPLGLTFDMDPIDGNWFFTFLSDNGTIPAPFDMSNQPDCTNPLFSSSTLPDGRTLVEWDFKSCTSYPGYGFHTRPQVFFTTRFDRTIPLPTSFTNCIGFGLNDGEEVWCGNGNIQETQPVCHACGTISIETSGGAINGDKSVNGFLDNAYSSFPNNGSTDLSGVGEYEINIEIADLEGIKKLDIVDILPNIGDFTLTPRVARNSEWSAEIAGPIVVEKFDINTQSWVSAMADITTELYATTYNPCYLDTGLQVRAQSGLTEPAVVGCDATDFSSTNPAMGAKAFAITWENVADPLVFGELLRVRIPIQQLTGEVDPPNGSVAWNSFAVTGTQPDDDELFSFEPLKVGLQMLNGDNVSLGNRVWNDINANGIQDPTEIGIPGVTVSLFDNAGVPVMMGGQPYQAITDQFGNYKFPGLDANTTYLISLDNVADFSTAGPLAFRTLSQVNQGTDDAFDSDAAFFGSFPATFAMTGAIGTDNDTYDIGFFQGATICGYAWEDSDRDGVQDMSENSTDSVQVELVNAAGVVIATTTTNAAGNYSFPNITPASYTLQITSLTNSGHVFTTPNATSNDDLDSDVIGNSIGTIVLGSGDLSCNHDIGITLPLPDPAAIIGTVWDELTVDGLQDNMEIGVENIQVDLLDAAQFVIATTFTDANGDYAFTDLEPNEGYFINVVPGINNPITQFQDAGADDTVDSDVDPITGTTALITPGPNETVDHVDAGIVFPYAIGNHVWIDANNNGILDFNEGPVAGVALNIYDAVTGNLLNTTTTDINGRYIFTDLQPGDYYVEVALPSNLISTTDISSSNDPNVVDTDDNGTGILSANYVQSDIITIVPGGGSPGSPNWTEADHGQPINGIVYPVSNPKAYYTVDFGLQYKMDCLSRMVEYAITNGAVTKPGQTTDYFSQDPPQNLQNSTNHIQMVQQAGVIRSYDFCTIGQWTYYFNPLDPEEFLFAIEHGTNVTPIEYIELRVEDIVSDRYDVGTNNATFVLARDWYIQTVNDTPFLDAGGNNTTVNVRFYFPEEEFQEILDEAIAEATLWGGYLPTANDVYWFNKDNFDPAVDIDTTGSSLTTFNINTLRNSTTNAAGSNTIDGIAGSAGNGKNHIQFNGIDRSSGGTAAISINRFALPVAIQNFFIEVEDCNAKLTWAADTESNFSHYIIEKSVDGRSFKFVEKMIAVQSVAIDHYNYVDNNIDENYFYRLKLMNLDGTYSYSNTVASASECAGDVTGINVFPNPISIKQSSLSINFQSKFESVKELSITDSFGNEKMSFTIDALIGKNALAIDISNLVPGVHVVTVKGTKGKLKSKRFMVVRD